MSQKSKKKATSPETIEEASRVAKSIQKPGQTKEQTRLIANGIQKGIEQYKKLHKAKSRELDKRLKSSQKQANSISEVERESQIDYRQHWLPWMLLVVSWSWAGFYFFFQ
jgi:hypothetical protein